MSTAKKQTISPPDEDVEELGFDTKNDWRKEVSADDSNLFKEDDMEASDEDLDTSIFSLDTKGEIKKESVKEHLKAQREAIKHARRKKSGEKSDTLASLQEAASGAEVEDDDELEILTEEDKALVNDPIFTNKGDQYPQIHGNYFLLDHLVDGGMAKVCRARYLGEGDEADKMVAIKMVQEKFSSDESFVQMFVDEIKVSFGLNHPNINMTFDYGKIGKNLFVSMEYIHGKDLMVVIDELKKKSKTLPVPMAIFIASKMAEALHYAHNFTNKLTGQKYNIVHRDISPHNAMLSYDGFVKVIDFGIAKADTNSTEEEEGTVKGKINYFAPEYLEGKKIDHRYDQFAVALTLWEMLTGDKTFKGKDQLLTLKTILECNPEFPSKHNKKVPKELDKIIMKALSRDPGQRYKNMEDFNKELMKCLYKNYPDFHESDISKLMKTLFKKDYEGDLAKFKEFGQYTITDIVEKINAFKDFQVRQKEKASAGKAREMQFDFGFEDQMISAKGKKGLDSLISSRKKEKPGKKSRESYRDRQKALQSMLEDEGGFGGESSLERNKGKLIFFGILLLGFFQREVIFKTLFETGDLSDPTKSNVVEVQKNQLIKELKNERKKQQENMKFLNQLRAKNDEGDENAKEGEKVKDTEKPIVNNQPQPVKKVPVASSPPLAKKPVVEQRPIKPQPEPVQVKAQEKPLEFPKAVAKVRPAPKPVQPVKAVEVKKESVDIEDLSFEDLKKRMEEQLAKREKRIKAEKPRPLPETTAVNNAPAQQPQPTKGPIKVQAATPGVSSGAITPLAEAKGLEEGGSEESFGEEGSEGEESITENESLEEMMDSKKIEGIENQLNMAKEDFKKENRPMPVEEVKAAVQNVNQQAAPIGTPVAEVSPTVTPTTAPQQLSAAQKELKDLQEKMAKLIEDDKRKAEGPSIDKVNIQLSKEEQQQISQAEANQKSEEDIQRELASRLKELDEEPADSPAPAQGEEGVLDGVVDFIKTRKAFSWIFKD